MNEGAGYEPEAPLPRMNFIPQRYRPTPFHHSWPSCLSLKRRRAPAAIDEVK